MARVVEDLLPRGHQPHRRAERLAGAGIAGVPGVRAAGDLQPQPVAPGRPERQPDGTIRARIPLWPAAHRFHRGHRLRLQVSSGAHPWYARNPGTGQPLGTAVRLVPARQRVFHDPGHPSALLLPVPL